MAYLPNARCLVAFSDPNTGIIVPTINSATLAVRSADIRQTETGQNSATLEIDDDDLSLLQEFSVSRSEKQAVSVWVGWADYLVEIFSGWIPVTPTVSYKNDGRVSLMVTLSAMSNQVFKQKKFTTGEPTLATQVKEALDPDTYTGDRARVVNVYNPYLSKMEPRSFGTDAKFTSGYSLLDMLEEIALTLNIELETSWSGEWPSVDSEVQYMESLREFVNRMSEKYSFRYVFAQKDGDPVLRISDEDNDDTGDYDWNFAYFSKESGRPKLNIPYIGGNDDSMLQVRNRVCTAVTSFSIKEGLVQKVKYSIGSDGEIRVYKEGVWYRLDTAKLNAAQKAGKLPTLLGESGIYAKLGTRDAYQLIAPYVVREKIPADAASKLADKAPTFDGKIPYNCECVVSLVGDPLVYPGDTATLTGIHEPWNGRKWLCDSVQHQIRAESYVTSAHLRLMKPLRM